MEIDPMLFWNILLTVVVAPFAWVFSKMVAEIKRLQILLNKTREEYATKHMVEKETQEIFQCLRRLEDKIDRLVEKG
jgi:membrane protein insertase Oxa1/YidC/SpoIIIJ